MRVLLVAAPGAGKGSQAQKLACHYRVAHLSSGEFLRHEAKAGSDIGKRASDFPAARRPRTRRSDLHHVDRADL